MNANFGVMPVGENNLFEVLLWSTQFGLACALLATARVVLRARQRVGKELVVERAGRLFRGGSVGVVVGLALWTVLRRDEMP